MEKYFNRFALATWDQIWHRTLRRPYQLRRVVDGGDGVPVVLLHGLGRDAAVWEHLVEKLDGQTYRVVAFDLLGFGRSPKPDWLHYTIDDHVRALAASLRRAKLREPAIIVGHSMGCLVAVRFARLYPQLVKHLVLYEMPLYSGLPDSRRYRLRLNFYFKLYKQIIKYQAEAMSMAEMSANRRRLYKAAHTAAEKVMGFTMSADVWRSFVRSLEHVIIGQRTNEDIKLVKAPIDVIYGSRDRLVIRGKTKQLFGEDVTNITAHTIRESHRISVKACSFIAGRIEAAL